MKIELKKILSLCLIASLFAMATINFASAESPTENRTLQETMSFLTTVVGLDLAKYSLDMPSPPPGYDPEKALNITDTELTELNRLMNVEGPTYRFKCDKGSLKTLSMFCNGYLSVVNIYSLGNSDDNYIYLDKQSTDIKSQANNILGRYQTYLSQKANFSTSFLSSMQSVLNKFDINTPVNTTLENINFQVSQSGINTILQWIYADKGIIMDWKKIVLDFKDGYLAGFQDSWGLYKVSEVSSISSDEVIKNALDAAQKVKLGNGTIDTPDLTNAPYDMYFAMQPYRGDDPEFPTKLQRDPYTLYPSWHLYFYFNETIGDLVGIQVGVWGDTAEISFARGYGFLGTSSYYSGSNTPEASSTTSNQSYSSQEESMNPVTLPIAIFAVISALSISAVIFRRKKK
ncbi:MAG: hypothetical protein ACFCUE_13895 [Candidatus Bathyarchaeia archaeon]|jgi:hypothetical protein